MLENDLRNLYLQYHWSNLIGTVKGEAIMIRH